MILRREIKKWKTNLFMEKSNINYCSIINRMRYSSNSIQFIWKKKPARCCNSLVWLGNFNGFMKNGFSRWVQTYTSNLFMVSVYASFMHQELALHVFIISLIRQQWFLDGLIWVCRKIVINVVFCFWMHSILAKFHCSAG